ncbi:low-density lipoprotein receptor-related protein 1B [Platysternon megacephalum]|uniref:Low-density lipoprotein receptor-related protein 1B n=1 Tax=Platysternon megacephalum TaxID=55544 RepID=A0A4D9EHP7_9SAUR|nr:low-density lipoprotein receptor-related protein 1B [Platysternon megacephalum]
MNCHTQGHKWVGLKTRESRRPRSCNDLCTDTYGAPRRLPYGFPGLLQDPIRGTPNWPKGWQCKAPRSPELTCIASVTSPQSTSNQYLSVHPSPPRAQSHIPGVASTPSNGPIDFNGAVVSAQWARSGSLSGEKFLVSFYTVIGWQVNPPAPQHGGALAPH